MLSTQQAEWLVTFYRNLPGQTAFDQMQQLQQPQQFPELLQPESQEPFERYPAQS